MTDAAPQPSTGGRPLVRPAGPQDDALIEEALLSAFNWSNDRPALGRDEVMARPEIAHYVAGWPRPGDVGVVAEVDGQGVGAAWLRYLPVDEPGYGFVAADVPELSIGVVPERRGQGVGRALLRGLLDAAVAARIDRVSLSVERGNRAQELYRREGFTVVGGDATSDTMLIDLTRRAAADDGSAGC